MYGHSSGVSKALLPVIGGQIRDHNPATARHMQKLILLNVDADMSGVHARIKKYQIPGAQRVSRDRNTLVGLLACAARQLDIKFITKRHVHQP
ncbi:hypothetical protein A3746_32535 [Oleibacter sp. HI0075]|nr:hypothetical protein A3746_32535 [Oleibacter sp. HI0075]